MQEAGSFFPGVSVRRTPRWLLVFLTGLRQCAAVIFEGETVSHFTLRTSGEETNVGESLVRELGEKGGKER